MSTITKKPSSHWTKYKVYYLVGVSFILLLTFLLLFNSQNTREIKRVNRQLEEIKNKELPNDFPNNPRFPRDDRDPEHRHTEGSFTFPSKEVKNENWLEETVFQNKVRNKFRIWVNSVKYLPSYRIGGAAEPEQHALFYGPPGSGKSYIAQKFAENEGLAYFFAKFGTEIYSGSSQVKVNKTMKEAEELLKKYGNSKPVVIIIDEIDGVGIKNPAMSGGSVQEVNALLTMIDDIKNKGLNIIVIGITNYPKVLDDALKRAGRLGRQIEVPYLTREEITNMVKYLEKDLKRERTGSYKHEGNRSKWEKEKEKEKEIEWTANFWPEVLQIAFEAFEKCKQEGIGISYTELEQAVKEALASKVSKNSTKITPQSSDVRTAIEEKVAEKIKNKPKPREPDQGPKPERVPTPAPTDE